MYIESFALERNLAPWETNVKYNLSSSGVQPCKLQDIVDEDTLHKLLTLELEYCQSNGSLALREAISKLYPGAGPDNVLVTIGSAEANFITAWTLLEPDDEVIFMLPAYKQLWGLIKSFGATVKPLWLKEELGWQLDINELKELISPKTKMIFLCDPNNPTGSIIRDEIKNEIIQIAQEANCYLIVDEVYKNSFRQTNNKELNQLAKFNNKFNKTIVNSGLSKSYGLPGLRIGWTVGSVEYIEQACKRRDYTTLAPAILSDRIAAYLLDSGVYKKLLQRTQNILNENLPIVQQWVDKHKDIFTFIPPQASAVVFLKHSLDLGSRQLVEKLRQEKDLLTVAGEDFGMQNGKYLRIGYGMGKEKLAEGLRLIGEMVTDLIPLRY